METIRLAQPVRLPAPIAAARQVFGAFRAWRDRARTRNALDRLGADQLRDIGLVRTAIGYDRMP